MKRTFLFNAMCASFALVSAIACQKENPDPAQPGNGGNGGDAQYTLIASPLSLEFGWNSTSPQTVTVTTNAPSGFVVGQTADWYDAQASGNKISVVPQVNEGEARSHDLVISAEGANSVTIRISQDAKGEIHASLQGEKYIVWQLDANSSEFLGDKIILSLAENGSTCQFMIWPNGDSLIGEESTGPNFYGNQGYMALHVGTIGWSGSGYVATGDENFLEPAFSQITADKGEGWYFHAAIKGTKGAGTNFQLCDVSEKSYTVQWDSYDISENEWTEVEIPMTDVLATGWTGPVMNTNNLVVASGSHAGDKVHYDAVFIYKK